MVRVVSRLLMVVCLMAAVTFWHAEGTRIRRQTNQDDKQELVPFYEVKAEHELKPLCEVRAGPYLPIEWTPEIGACIRGWNNLVLDEVSLDDCKARCLAETDFYCSSVEYHSRSRRCSLSENTSKSYHYGYRHSCPNRGWTYTETIEWSPETDGCFIKDNEHGRAINFDRVSLDDCKARCQSHHFQAHTGYFCSSVEYHSSSQSCLIGEASNISDSYREPCPREGWTYTQLMGLFGLPPTTVVPASAPEAATAALAEAFSDVPQDDGSVP